MTAIPNLFLASDYVQTFTDLATMEGANEAARRAVNGILERAGRMRRSAGSGTCTSPSCWSRGGPTIGRATGRACRGTTPRRGWSVGTGRATAWGNRA